MIRFEILLPLFSNDGRPIEREKFVETGQESGTGPLLAIWASGKVA